MSVANATDNSGRKVFFYLKLIFIALFAYFASLREKYFANLFRTARSGVVDIVTIILLIALPVIISLRIFNNYKEKSNPYNVVVVQPNIDPYYEKFDGLSPIQQLHKLLDLADSLIDDSTDYIVGPETALIKGIWEEDIEKDYSINTIWQFLDKYPRAKFVLGLSSYKLYNEGEPVSATARQIKGSEIFYDAYNTAMQLDSTQVIQLYHKSQLVLGVERMPYPKVFGVLENFAIDLGGIVGSLGIQEERTTFKASDET